MRADAARVIAQLERLADTSRAAQNQAAGTAARRGFPERRHIRADSAALRALWSVADELGMNRERLDEFIRRRYAGLGLHGLRICKRWPT